MTIQEALKSGKRYKRPHHAAWHTLDNEYITTKDSLATDWEVQEEKFEVTESEIIKMLIDVIHPARSEHITLEKLKAGKYK